MNLPKPIAVAIDPPRLLRAVKRRAKKWRNSMLSTHSRAVAQARQQGKLVIADMDWYGYSNVDFAEIFAANSEFGGRFHVQKIPRAAVFSFKREPACIVKRWECGENPVAATYHGLKLWELCRASIVKELGYDPGHTPPLTEAERILTEQFYHWSVLCIDGVEKTLEAVQPYAVVVFQGGLFDSRCVVECAARRGIRTIAVETSFIGDHALVDSLSGIIINRHSLGARGSTLYEARALDPRLDPVGFWRDSLSRKFMYHRTGGEALDGFRLPHDKKLVLVIGQVAVDASISLDSPLFRSPADLIAEVAGIAERHPDWHVVARLHPNEAVHIDTRREPEGPGTYLWDNTLVDLQRRNLQARSNLTVISGKGVSTYELMERCCVGVTINSQAGLEMTLLGKPVVTAGRCYYAQNGFTWDVARRELLEAAIEGAMRTGLTAEETHQLHDFCRYLFWHYLLPVDPKAASQRVERLREILGLAKNHESPSLTVG